MVAITKDLSALVKVESLKGGKAMHANPADWKNREKPSILVLFDVDGTLSLSRKVHPHF